MEEKDNRASRRARILQQKERDLERLEEMISLRQKGERAKITSHIFAYHVVRYAGCHLSKEEVEAIAKRLGYKADLFYQNYLEKIEAMNKIDNDGYFWRRHTAFTWWYKLEQLEQEKAQNTITDKDIDWESRRWQLACQIFNSPNCIKGMRWAMEQADEFIAMYKEQIFQ